MKTKNLSESLRVIRTYGLTLLLVLCGGVLSQDLNGISMFFEWWGVDLSNLFVCVLCLLAIVLAKSQNKEEVIVRVLIFTALQWPLILCAIDDYCRNEFSIVIQFVSVALPLSIILARIMVIAVGTLLSWYLLYITYHIRLPLEDGSNMYIGPKGGKFYWKNGRKKYVKK